MTGTDVRAGGRTVGRICVDDFDAAGSVRAGNEFDWRGEGSRLISIPIDREVAHADDSATGVVDRGRRGPQRTGRRLSVPRTSTPLATVSPGSGDSMTRAWRGTNWSASAAQKLG